jgi:DNA-directed RNA polymerase beta subunit
LSINIQIKQSEINLAKQDKSILTKNRKKIYPSPAFLKKRALTIFFFNNHSQQYEINKNAFIKHKSISILNKRAWEYKWNNPFYSKNRPLYKIVTCLSKTCGYVSIYSQKITSSHGFAMSSEKLVQQANVVRAFQFENFNTNRNQVNKIKRAKVKVHSYKILKNCENYLSMEYSLEKYHRSNQDTCLVHKPSVVESQWVESGDLLADCSASIGGELSLGQNILIGYMPWEGYNFEDAILISERLVYDDLYTSIHIERYEVNIEETKLGMEEITREIPEIEKESLKNLNSLGIIKIGSWVQEGNILVGKVTPVNKKMQTNYQKLLYLILDKTVSPVRDSSLRAPKGIQAKVIGIQIFKNPSNTNVRAVDTTKFIDIEFPESKIDSNVKSLPEKQKLKKAAAEEIDMSREMIHFLGAPPPTTKLSGSSGLRPPHKVQSASIKNVLKKQFSKSNTKTAFLSISEEHKQQFKNNNHEKQQNYNPFFTSANFFDFYDFVVQKIDKKITTKKQSMPEEYRHTINSFSYYAPKNTWPITLWYKNNKDLGDSFLQKTKTQKIAFSEHWTNKKVYAKNKIARFFSFKKESFLKADQLTNFFSKDSYIKALHMSIIAPQNATIFTITNKNKNSSFSLNNLHSVSKQQTLKNKKIGFSSFKDQKNLLKGVTSIQVYLAERRRVQVGDKMAGRHGNKGIISEILPIEDLPFLPDGTPLDMVLNPLGVPSRMNVGQIYECLLGLAGKHLGENYKIFPFDEIYGAEASRSFVYSKLYNASIKTGKTWLFNPNLPGKIGLYDGRTGESFHQAITVGYAYILRLVHMVDDKMHCLTPDHDVLTTKGWRPINKIGCNDKVATLQKNGVLSYKKPTNIFLYKNYKGPLFHIKNRHIDLLVTPNHRMYVRKIQTKSFINAPIDKQKKSICRHAKKLQVYLKSSISSFKLPLQNKVSIDKPRLSIKHVALLKVGIFKILNKFPKNVNKNCSFKSYIKLASSKKNFDGNKLISNLIFNNIQKNQSTIIANTIKTKNSLLLFAKKTNATSKGYPRNIVHNFVVNEQKVQKVDFNHTTHIKANYSLKQSNFSNYELIEAKNIIGQTICYLKNAIWPAKDFQFMYLPKEHKRNNVSITDTQRASLQPLINAPSTFIKSLLKSNIDLNNDEKHYLNRNYSSGFICSFSSRAFLTKIVNMKSWLTFFALWINGNWTISYLNRFDEKTQTTFKDNYKIVTNKYNSKIFDLLKDTINKLGYQYQIVNKQFIFTDNELGSYLISLLNIDCQKFIIESKNITPPGVIPQGYINQLNSKTTCTVTSEVLNLLEERIQFQVNINRKKNQKLPSWVWQLSQKQARFFLTMLCLVNKRLNRIHWRIYSSKKKPLTLGRLKNKFKRELNQNVIHYYTNSHEFANDIMRLALHSGWSANNYLQQANTSRGWQISIIKSVRQNNPVFNLSKTITHKFNSEKIFQYAGPVFCLTVPNEVFYVRRNGIPVWTGNSRSTGPYSLVTQQPLRGRSKHGGQRLGEMEVWALEGYGAAFTLLEMLTIKSDDMSGRMTLWSNLILNKEISIGTPESFKVLVCELQALCLDIGLFRISN